MQRYLSLAFSAVVWASLPACAHQTHQSGLGGSQQGWASWYGDSHQGHRTASGEPFDMNALTAAHRSLPMNSVVRVTSLSSGKSITVRINDRGPFSRERILDVSKAGAQRLGFIDKGVDKVQIDILSVPGK
ncbi:MAG: septal ring lytic transglycosylase RlpA family protein [Pseudobdellovibrionaceae bacterium]